MLADAVGLVGVFLIVAAYFLIQSARLTSDMLAYPLMNLIGALLILVSLAAHWNTPSVIIELIWIGISVCGIAKILRRKA